MYCYDCGNKIESWHEYCSHCGADLFQNEKKMTSLKPTYYELLEQYLPTWNQCKYL
jgi:predicted amidophosphoribosyltransferase